MANATVVICDDHPIVRQGLCAVLEARSGFTVVGGAGDGRTGAELIERLHPDLAIVDLMLPRLNGLEVTRLARRSSPKTHVLLFSMYADEPHVIKALRAGALAYVLKGASTTSLIYALHEALRGRYYLSPPLSNRAIEAYIAQAGVVAQPADRYVSLSPREREVLELAAKGLTNSEIGQQLIISPRTAETHHTHILHKLGLKTRHELALYAVQRGIIPVDE